VRGFQNYGPNIDPRAGISLFGAIPFVQVFTASATWQNPLSLGLPARLITVVAVGGGAGGSSAICSSSGGVAPGGGAGGPGGAYARFQALVKQMAHQVTITVQSGGQPGGSQSVPYPTDESLAAIIGDGGGTASFGALAVATGGVKSSTSGASAEGGTATVTHAYGAYLAQNGSYGGNGQADGAGIGGYNNPAAGPGGGGGNAPYYGGPNYTGGAGGGFGSTATTGAGPAGGACVSHEGTPTSNEVFTAGNGANGASPFVRGFNWTTWLAPVGQGGAGGGGSSLGLTGAGSFSWFSNSGAGGAGGGFGAGGGGGGTANNYYPDLAGGGVVTGAGGQGGPAVVVVLTV
jgi:hypothetical protein